MKVTINVTSHKADKAIVEELAKKGYTHLFSEDVRTAKHFKFDMPQTIELDTVKKTTYYGAKVKVPSLTQEQALSVFGLELEPDFIDVRDMVIGKEYESVDGVGVVFNGLFLHVDDKYKEIELCALTLIYDKRAIRSELGVGYKWVFESTNHGWEFLKP